MKIFIYTDPDFPLSKDNVFISMPYSSLSRFKGCHNGYEVLKKYDLKHLAERWGLINGLQLITIKECLIEIARDQDYGGSINWIDTWWVKEARKALLKFKDQYERI